MSRDVMATLSGIRHAPTKGRFAPKGRQNDISEGGIRKSRIVAGGVRPFTDAFYGREDRSRQTMFAMLSSPNLAGCFFHNTVIPEIGHAQLGKAMANDVFQINVQAGMSKLTAVFASHPQEQIEEWLNYLYKGLRIMFAKMLKRAEVGVVPNGIYCGHTPFIELAGIACLIGSGFKLKDASMMIEPLEPLQSLEFVFYTDETVGVTLQS